MNESNSWLKTEQFKHGRKQSEIKKLNPLLNDKLTIKLVLAITVKKKKKNPASNILL